MSEQLSLMSGGDAGAVLPGEQVERLAADPFTSKIAAAIYGGAIGDALGHPTEFVGSFDAIESKWGPGGVKGYEIYWNRNGQRFAPYTDDTQMAEQVLRALLWGLEGRHGLNDTMNQMASRFIDWAEDPQGGHRAPGNACLSGCRALESGTPWWRAGGASAGGCGSVMRAYPFGLLFSADLAQAEEWAVAHSKLTHRDPIALAACAAMAVGMIHGLRNSPTSLQLSEMVAAACRYSPRTAAMMAEAVDEALSDVSPRKTLQRLQGWAAHEAIAAAVYIVARHPEDFRAAVLEGANTPGDSDSLATLAGSLVGARTGLGGIPPDWIVEIERSRELGDLAMRTADLLRAVPAAEGDWNR
ncbi:MAG: ADP-ribosylglycohydrolase family protein [Myxococcota bacterium]